MKQLLWIGDAACGSGFGHATANILPHLQRQYQVSVIGVNYRGDPPYPAYPVYPAYVGGDQLGINRIPQLIPREVQPDIVVIQTNPWNIPLYMGALSSAYGPAPLPPVVGIIAVEGKNCRGTQLNHLSKAIFWTEFARQEAIKGGLRVRSSVVPLGVDQTVFYPGDKTSARKFLGLPEKCMDAFIVCNVNRNQTRKRLDLSIQYFAEWTRTHQVEDAYLYLHVLPGSTIRCDLDQLAKYYGMQGRLILAQPKDVFRGAPIEYVRATYQAADVQVNSGLGEGWGLTSMEGAACRTAQIAGDYAAFGEWARGGFFLVQCPEEGIMPDVQNMIGAAPDRLATIEAFDLFYRDQDTRARYAQAGLDLVSQPCYRWEHIGEQFANEICS